MHPDKTAAALAACVALAISQTSYAAFDSFTTRDAFDSATNTLPVHIEGWDSLDSAH